MDGALTLVGMLDSPFVRRVAITLRRYEMPYTNLPLMTIGHAEQFAAYSPLKRAPALVLPSGEALFDSHLILQHLDELAAPELVMMPWARDERLLCRQVLGITAGIADKAVSAVYEKAFHPAEQRSARLLQRIEGQLRDALAWLEQRAPATEFLFGARLSHADVLLGTALCFAREAALEMFDMGPFPRVRAWYGRLEQLDEFVSTYLPLEPPR
jgi:glutathione S-transferase